MAEKKPIDWAKIRREWDAGQLSIRDIAGTNGCSEAVIRKRAKGDPDKGLPSWPPRPTLAEQVRTIVRTPHESAHSAHETEEVRTSLEAFERVVALLLRHRKFLAGLHDLWAVCIQDAIDIRKRKTENNHRGLAMKDVQAMADVLQKASGSIAKLIPLERRAFGLTDEDGPSEFDMLTAEEIAVLDKVVKRALGLPEG